MTAFNALEILKNRIITLSLNHKIGSRDIAKQEVKEIVMGIKTHVIPTLEKALTELEKLKRDVKRFIDLTFSDDINSDDWQEYLALKDKLSKVGKEDV